MILATWNVNSINKRLPQLLDWLEKVKPNLVCLQETKVVDEKFPVAEIESSGYKVAFYGEKAYNGVAIISDKPLSDVETGLQKEVGPASKRIISGSYDGVRILDVYIPNGGEPGSEKFAYKLEWLAALKEHLATKEDPNKPLVITGDFNIAPQDLDVFDPKAAAGGILVTDEERAALEEIRKWGLVDVFRKLHPEAALYSWWDYRMNAFRRNMGFRIDHIWATAVLAEKARSIYIDKEPRKLEQPSDHAPVVAEFAV
ncbi:MAG: exodeoxyribonuclease III [Candidatus Obscuribacterales bacterium]|nr:exodeoxyribonuclease III [Candidatus Obscuribacterales bacterium]